MPKPIVDRSKLVDIFNDLGLYLYKNWIIRFYREPDTHKLNVEVYASMFGIENVPSLEKVLDDITDNIDSGGFLDLDPLETISPKNGMLSCPLCTSEEFLTLDTQDNLTLLECKACQTEFLCKKKGGE